ncbi:MAG: 30S ribosome-binding factor RbfA [Xanthomonadales bacterium]|nr:30S ribosome-binding factor RbfA [Gammaproteobacteria bacterium]MBT8050596.1 30S ribosome-binding factor RbfA [Gammaproteobacteria bacterium]MBT8056657.1 30S ribosome-binding factor RbfA [Gammaproteobacteria bacterium]NNJ80215.1 30S ribosome-binding factor RbfA [Xanthomonadales bacterium]NNL05571.1 30S ribosome-binding factor RbfA [Xanthomonadales bacterium]
MPREFKRSERVAGSLRRELASIIHKEVKDPGVGFISISDVEVSRDLAHAKVFVTVFEPDKADSSIKALNQASGYLRTQLGQAMRIRSVPELHFHHDASVETGRHMDELIESAISSDRHADDHEAKIGDKGAKDDAEN